MDLKLIHDFNIWKATVDIPLNFVDNVYALQQRDPGNTKSNCGGWHSTSWSHTKKYSGRDWSWLSPTVEKLLSLVALRWQYPFDRGWFNINKFGNSNNWHHHGQHPIVSVFYISVPLNSGSIEFCKDNTTFTYTPVTGDFLIFPGDLEHRVLESTATEDRISMAVNFKKINK